MAHLPAKDRNWLMAALIERSGSIAAKKCPECGKSHWSMIEDLHVMPLVEIKARGQRHVIRDDDARAFLLIECRNCGFTKFHDVAQLGYSAQLP